jgi:hypothetical protein
MPYVPADSTTANCFGRLSFPIAAFNRLFADSVLSLQMSSSSDFMLLVLP